jgi:phage baseplate assembly protein W
MSAERIITDFKDISMSFQSNPVNNDIIALKNQNAIARSLKNLVLTSRGERPFQNSLGSRVSRLLFDNLDEFVSSTIEDEIRSVIARFEPRVSLVSVNSTPDYDNNAIDVRIVYIIIGIDALPQQLTFALQPTR